MERQRQSVRSALQTCSCHICGKDFSTTFRGKRPRCGECWNRVRLVKFVKQKHLTETQLIMFWNHIVNDEKFHSFDYVGYFDIDGDVDRAIEHKYDEYDCDCSDMYSSRKCKQCRDHRDHEDYMPDHGINALYGYHQDQACDAYDIVVQHAPQMRRIFDLCEFNSRDQDAFLRFFEGKL